MKIIGYVLSHKFKHSLGFHLIGDLDTLIDKKF